MVRHKVGGRGGFPTGGFLALTLPTVPSGLDARDAADAHGEAPQTPRGGQANRDDLIEDADLHHGFP